MNKTKRKKTRSKTPTFLLELPLSVDPGQAKRLRAHFEAARCLYNTLLGEALIRLRMMRRDSQWQAARAMPRTHKQERNAAFARLRHTYGFSDYALQAFAKQANGSWMAEHLDMVTAQTLATRAYRAVNRVCLGQARRVRFKSRGRGLDSLEGKRNDTGLRFVLQPPAEGNTGWFFWGKLCLTALIDWSDPVVHYGLTQRIKYVRLLRRKASSSRAKGADSQGYRYFVQLAVEGKPYQKPKHTAGTDVIGLDLGPATIAIVPRAGEAQLAVFCAELAPDLGKKRRLERKLAAHRKSLHGRLAHEIVRQGNTIHLENVSYKAWQKQYGKSIGLRAPGLFVEMLKRTVAKTGGTLHEVSTKTTKLSQFCHGCNRYEKKPLKKRWHCCVCGIGPVQRDLYSAFLAAYLNPPDNIPSIAQEHWEGAETRLSAAVEVLRQRAKEGQTVPRSVGIPNARARLPKSFAKLHQELIYRRGRLEALE